MDDFGAPMQLNLLWTATPTTCLPVHTPTNCTFHVAGEERVGEEEEERRRGLLRVTNNYAHSEL